MPSTLLRLFCTTAITATALAAPAFGFVVGTSDCGELGDGFGPYDFRTYDQVYVHRVERAHFPTYVEFLERGKTNIYPAGDVDFVLRTFPTHHRALQSMSNAAFKFKSDPPPGSHYTVQCWFERALRFKRDDGTVYMLYGIFMLRKGAVESGVKLLEKSKELAPADANIYYNLGLSYFSLKDYDKALENAHTAYRMGFPLPGLREKLIRAGKWKDAPATAASKPADAAGETEPSTAPTPIDAPAAADDTKQ
ncbi:MAG: hypothetical protein KF778_04450 [Rhodocyclaceae bacterium]|nr:hypothetical protein [Rhodocyclaceae bacterium]MBX3667633.1 hypothetical protein [Rhodocyclaceae bacterium]